MNLTKPTDLTRMAVLPNADDPEAIANYFWQLAGSVEDFPRRLEGSIAIALPLSVVALPSLTVAQIVGWLRQRQVQCPINVSDRRVSACVIAQGGHGIIFVDGSDAMDERRFSIAHDTGHFLADYWLPRTSALRQFGEEIKPVLDGFRCATPQERLGGLVAGMPLPIFSSLMERGDDGLAECHETVAREDIADQVALELLAPRRDLQKLGRSMRLDWESSVSVARLGETAAVRYGLPLRIALQLADRVARQRRSSKSVRKFLGM
jgi:hypothetical protein